MTLVAAKSVSSGDYVTDGKRLAEVHSADATGVVMVDAATDETFRVTAAEMRAWRVVQGWRSVGRERHGVA